VRHDAHALARAAGEAMYEKDNASRGLGMKLEEIGPGYARMSMTVREDMVNGHAICHGGLIFTLADSTFAFACNSYNHVAVAQGASIEFLAPGKLGDVLTAIGEERHHAGKTGVYDIRVSNQDGRTIALFRGKSFRIGGHLVEPGPQEEKP
jgi:acyl-CoA thioesterase